MISSVTLGPPVVGVAGTVRQGFTAGHLTTRSNVVSSFRYRRSWNWGRVHDGRSTSQQDGCRRCCVLCRCRENGHTHGWWRRDMAELFIVMNATLPGVAIELDNPVRVGLNVIATCMWLAAIADIIHTPAERWYNPRGKVIIAFLVTFSATKAGGVFLPIAPAAWFLWLRRLGGIGYSPPAPRRPKDSR